MTPMRFFVLTWVAFSLLGCESAGDVITTRRAAVEKTFSSIQALGPKVMGLEPLTETKLAPRPVPLLLESAGGTPSNALFVYAADLAKPGQAQPVNLRTLDALPLLHCGALLERGVYANDTVSRPMPSIVESHLSACARARYALVIVEREFTKPALQLETRRFASGKYRADVYVFDLGTGEKLGGFQVAAKNEDSVMLIDGDDDHVRRLIRNLESTVYDALRDAAREAVPGALPPPGKH